MTSSDTPQTPKIAFDQFPWLYRVTVLLLFVAAAALRLYDLTDPPLDFHPTRQLYSALKARGMYYATLGTAVDWQRELAVTQWKAQGLIEPPIMERISASLYSLLGQEALWVPRLLASLCWLLGGVALLQLTRRVAGTNGAVFALAFYLFTPYLVFASRAFQPDPLMVALMIAALYALLRWERQPSWRWAAAAGLLAGLAIFAKTVVIFPLAAAFISVPLVKLGWRGAVRNRQVWLMAFLALLPYMAFYIYGLWVTGELQSQFSLRFFPQLWLTPGFWLQANANISKVVGFEFFLAALLGVGMLTRKADRALLLALWAGYLVYALVLPYHIASHDYYQLPLVPIVALGLAVFAQQMAGRLQGAPRLKAAVLLAVLLVFVAIQGWTARAELKREDYRQQPAFWQQISGLFPRTASLIAITPDYGYRLEYWGWRSVSNWMSAADFALRQLAGQTVDLEDWFRQEVAGKEYFLITEMDELARQPEIEQLLQQNYPVWKSGPGYIIYDLRVPAP